MGEKFFSSREAAKITGCTLRQLQYWRERGVVVPPISATGTGRSIYYSRSELVELALMESWLSLGLSFEVASAVLGQLKKHAPEFTDGKTTRRLMLVWNEAKGILKIDDFDREVAIARLDEGLPVIPLWLDRVHHRLERELKAYNA
jgi:DNA-binding transcriptional MerR regulator